MENCRHFVCAISPQIPVREMPVAAGPESDSQVQMEDSQVVSPDSQQVSRGTTRAAGYSSLASASASGLTLSDLAHKVVRFLESGDIWERGLLRLSAPDGRGVVFKCQGHMGHYWFKRYEICGKKNTNRSLSSTIFTLVFIIIDQFQNHFHSMNAFVFQVTSSETHRHTNQSRMHIDVPQDQLSLMIRLCLTDSNFPAFVEAVEKELTNLTSSEQI